MKMLKAALFLFLLVLVSGCNFLDYDESTELTKEDVFSNFERSKSYLTNIYSHLPSGFNSIDGAMRSSASDDAEEVWELSNVQKFNDGSWSAIQTLDDSWGEMYSGIRAVNQFLVEIDSQTFPERQYNDDYEQLMEQLELYPYEARFLRAYFYYELLKRYGSVPLVTSVLTAEEANNVEQAPFGEVLRFILEETDAVSLALPVSYSSIMNNETGRATRGAALALKAKALLYAASPLNNPNGDIQKWQEAAIASKALIDSSWYALENNYNNVVNNYTGTELIFGRRLGNSNSFERSNFPIGFEGARPGTSPTQNLVNSYEMQSNGLAIDEQGSGYDPENPYEGRDPRLSSTVMYNGSTWKGTNLEIYNGGLHGPPQARATKTGYYLKKYVRQDINLDPTNTTTKEHTWVLFRYGEVLLNYAEAMNEVYGPEDDGGMGMTARQAVNMVRARSDMPEFPSGLSKMEFREKLRNERRVELAFEDHRFWDIRRWKIGDQTTDIYGVNITKESDDEFTYEQKLVEQRVFEEKMYRYPLPQSELFNNPNLQQNSGW